MSKKCSGKLVFDMCPSLEYPRHSEGDFCRLGDGSILFAYSRFSKSTHDDSPSHIVAMRSQDEGHSWSSPETIITPDVFGGTNAMSVSFLPLDNGDLGIFFGIKGPHKKIVLGRSCDGGRSFYHYSECTLHDRARRYVLNNCRVERLQSGRIIVPLAYHRSGSDALTGKFFFDPCSSVCILYSDDDGESWNEAPDVIHPPFTHTQSGLQEPGVIELYRNILLGYFRTDKMYQYESFSRDGGLHWTVPQPSRFTSPLSPMKIIRRTQTNTLYALWNPIPNYLGRSQYSEGVWHGGRTPLVYAMSKDEGCTWSEMHVIEDHQDHGYCYPAPYFNEKEEMLVAYCSGGVKDGSCLARLSIMAVDITEE